MPHASPTKVERRLLLTGLAAMPAAALAQNAADNGSSVNAPAPSGPPPCQLLNPDELRALTALVARIIPSDALGGGAVEADVPVFIDRQLAGAYGAGAQFYRAGPFQPGTAQQGYQLAMTPSELVREGLARLDAAARATDRQAFADLPSERQDALMDDMQAGRLDMGPIPSNVFMNAMVDLTMEGFFSDPLYGGNKDMIGWKLVGFPGAYDSYAAEIERYNLEWRRPPVPMAADTDLGLQPGIAGPICTTR